MTILDKLRDTFQRRRYGDTPGDYDPDIDLLDVAADEIERLTADNERLRAALKSLIDSADGCAWSANIGTMDAAIEAARNALNQQLSVNSEDRK